MPSTVFDSDIFRDAFGSPAMRAIFCDEATIARYVEVEVALAAAEASVGVIPKDAAATIKRLARADAIDVAKLKPETDLVGYPIVGVVHQLATVRRCGPLVHWVPPPRTSWTLPRSQIKLRNLVEADLSLTRRWPRRQETSRRDGRPHASAARAPVTFG
jgi:3-carboxy-cis,cis-muconate cycloisomerase